MTNSKVREYLRQRVLGVLAIFIALTGTAIAQMPSASSDESARAVTSKKFKKLKQRVKALETLVATPAGGDLTGTYPNLELGPNTVGSNDIANNAVTTAKIADNAVINPKLADNAVNTTEIADDAVSVAKIADNAVGAAQITASAVGSSEIADNNVGANELKNITYDTTTTTAVAPGDVETFDVGAECASNAEEITWGGFWGDLTTNEDVSIQSALFFGNWLVYAGNHGAAAENFTGVVGCLAP